MRAPFERTRSHTLSLLALCATPGLAQEAVWDRPLTGAPSPLSAETSRLAVLEGGQVVAMVAPLGLMPSLALLSGQGNQAPMQVIPCRTGSPRMESIPMADGGVFLVGEMQGLNAASGPPIGASDGVLAKLSASGEIESIQRFGDVDSYALPTRATSDGAGGFIVGGRDLGAAPWTSPPLGSSWLMRFDASGAELWRRAVPGGSGVSALALDDLGTLLVGGRATTTEAFLARMQLDGTITWYVVLGPNSGMPLEVVPLPGGGLVELRDELPGPVVCVVRDAAGNQTASVDFNGGASEPTELIGLPNGDFLVAGVVVTASGANARFERHAADGTFQGAFDLAGPGQTVNDLTDVIVREGSLYFAADLTLAGGLRREVVGRIALEAIGVPGCAGRPNSTGSPAVTRALGSDVRADDALTLFTTGLPTPNAWGFYLASRNTGFVPNAGGSRGDLCLSGPIGRFAREGEIVSSGNVGRYHLVVDLDDVPGPTGATSVNVGETWHFQTWYRDNDPTATSNFSSAVTVTLR